ncbi:MAG TPA: histidine phosphatase family protein [Epulopiscium sp.]|nr:histidine phosphatase family protein [Candidatus Epulonipiscium sp.]
MRLYVVRHGETLWNTQKRMQGWGNSDLTEQGKAQAKLLGESLLSIDFNQVVCSPLGRTIETANHIIGDRDVDIVINDDFKEMGFGSWEGKSPETLKSNYPEQYNNIWTDATKYVPVDGETFQQVINRIIRGIQQIVDDNPTGNVLLVTHGMIVQLLLVHMKGLPLSELWNRNVVHPTSLTVIDIEPGSIKVIKEDDISHLE